MLGPLADGLAKVLDVILNMVQLLVIASIVISWVGADPNNQLVVIIRSITEPLYRPFRKISKGLPGPVDWSPMIVLLVVLFLQHGVVPAIRMLGAPSPVVVQPQ